MSVYLYFVGAHMLIFVQIGYAFAFIT